MKRTTTKRRIVAKHNPQWDEFKSYLLSHGWRVKTSPMLAALGMDEWIFLRTGSRGDLLFVDEEMQQWERKDFGKEVFGDYTNACKLLGSGSGLLSLIANLEKGLMGGIKDEQNKI